MANPATTLGSGTTVADRYRIVRFLGEGEPGGVYLATQEPLGREVVLKVLPPDTEDPHAAGRFRREAEALARLSHPACAEVIDYGTWHGMHYLVLRHVQGRTLAEDLERGEGWPGAEAVTLCLDLADGLAHAHAAGVVHRNLSPERVVLTDERGTRLAAILVDFGLAHIGRTDLDTTVGTAPRGTPGYLAPERVRGQPGEAPCDVFAVGVMLYEMLTGDLPFRKPTPTETLLATTRERVPPIDRAHPEVPTTAALTRVLQVATAPGPEDRFRDGRELSLALRAARVTLSDPSLARHSFSVVDGVCRLDAELVDRIDDPTPTLVPRRGASESAAIPPEPTATRAPSTALTLGIAVGGILLAIGFALCGIGCLLAAFVPVFDAL